MRELSYPFPPLHPITRQHPTAASTAEGWFISREACTARLKAEDFRGHLYTKQRDTRPSSRSGSCRLLAGELLFPRQNIREFLSEEPPTALGLTEVRNAGMLQWKIQLATSCPSGEPTNHQISATKMWLFLKKLKEDLPCWITRHIVKLQ